MRTCFEANRSRFSFPYRVNVLTYLITIESCLGVNTLSSDWSRVKSPWIHSFEGNLNVQASRVFAYMLHVLCSHFQMTDKPSGTSLYLTCTALETCAGLSVSVLLPLEVILCSLLGDKPTRAHSETAFRIYRDSHFFPHILSSCNLYD